MKKKDLIVVRGAGDLATGTIHRLKKAGFRLLVLEAEHPAAIRRQVALSEAVETVLACAMVGYVFVRFLMEFARIGRSLIAERSCRRELAAE